LIGSKKKKKEEGLHYDPTNIKISDLRTGFLLDYDFKTWEVVESYEYDWGDHFFSYEHKLLCEDDTCFLEIEEDDGLYLTLYKKINFSRLDDEVETHLEQHQKPPKKIHFEGKTFYRDSQSPGYFRNMNNDNWVEFISWTYYDDSEKYVLGISQWVDDSYEAAVGVVVKESAFSNILPRDNKA
jgi:hypothetical protein